VKYRKKVIMDFEMQYGLGLCYEHGKGVERDASQTFYWWQKAAGQGREVYSGLKEKEEQY
jgi:TPR repeat protein